MTVSFLERLAIHCAYLFVDGVLVQLDAVRPRRVTVGARETVRAGCTSCLSPSASRTIFVVVKARPQTTTRPAMDRSFALTLNSISYNRHIFQDHRALEELRQPGQLERRYIGVLEHIPRDLAVGRLEAAEITVRISEGTIAQDRPGVWDAIDLYESSPSDSGWHRSREVDSPQVPRLPADCRVSHRDRVEGGSMVIEWVAEHGIAGRGVCR
eukprot:COSAG03_NODE_4095_length_1688_cov_1.630585_1_plen_212_part_00